MSDFKSTTSFIKCDNLKIANQLWPTDYDIDNSFLKYSDATGLFWERSFNSLANVDVGLNDYIVMNNVKGGSNVNLTTNTNSYIRAGPGERFNSFLETGGVDGTGTGLTYTPRGQITLGLTKEDSDVNSSDISIHGSSLTLHSSLTNRELAFIGEKEHLKYPSSGEKLFQQSSKSFKIIDGDILKKENGVWIDRDTQSKTSSNILTDPLISGDLTFGKGKENTIFGPDSGTIGVTNEKKEISGIFKSHKALDESSSNIENFYKGWTIETEENGKIETNIIEEYNVGYSKLYGRIGNPLPPDENGNKADTCNNMIDNENTFKYNDYYEGWNLTVPAYTIYKASSTSSHIIRPSTVFKIVKNSTTYYETLTSICKPLEDLLFFENSYENYHGGTITIAGIPGSTSVTDGKNSTTITISNATESFIPARTNIVFTYGSQTATGIIANDVEEGSNTIFLINNSPDTSETLNVEIKPFNTGTITLSKQKYSEKNVDYTVKKSSILPTNVSITNSLNESSTSVVLTSALQENVPVGTTFKVGDAILLGSGAKDSTTLNFQYIVKPPVLPSVNERIYQRTLIAETFIKSDDFRKTSLSTNNVYKQLTKQDDDTVFYLSSQNKNHEKGKLYGEKIGKFLSDKKLGVYHREEEGFYIGWFIYLWNNKIPLNKNLNADIKSGTILKFTNPYDSSDTFDITVTDSLVNTPNKLTIPTDSIKRNIDGFNVSIKGFPESTTISSHDTSTHVITVSNAVTGALSDGTLVKISDGTNTFYRTVSSYTSSGSTHTMTLSSSVSETLDSNYDIEIMGIPENTTVDIPYGVIEGYNSRLNTVQFLCTDKNYIIDNTTYYCIKKGYKTTDSGETYYVALDENKILKSNYYNNWKIEVEDDKNRGYYSNSKEYEITNYTKDLIYGSYNDISGIIVDSETLPGQTKLISKDYYKGWRIVFSSSDLTNPDSINTNDNDIVKGIVNSHDATTLSSLIPNGTIITEQVNEVGVTNITISPPLTNDLASNTVIIISNEEGTSSERIIVTSSTTTVLTTVLTLGQIVSTN